MSPYENSSKCRVEKSVGVEKGKEGAGVVIRKRLWQGKEKMRNEDSVLGVTAA
jgi:hypothetical protein